MSLLNEEQFERMLKSNKYKKNIFSQAVCKKPGDIIIEKYENKVKNSHWYKIYIKIFEQEVDVNENSKIQSNGFDYLVRHFIKYAESKIDSRIQSKGDCLDIILTQLNLKILTVANKCIVMELNEQREKHNLEGENAKKRFEYFIRQYENVEKLKEFYDKYIVLTRILIATTERYINNINKIIDDLYLDKELIKKTFGIEENEFKIASISQGLGDTHNGGKTVALIELECGKKIIYKPRDLSINNVLNQIIHFLNLKGKILPLWTVTTLSMNDHGYEEFIDYSICKSNKELKQFYIRFGEILAFAYIFNATDLHMENLIAHGEYPVLIDLETFIQQPQLINDKLIKMRIKHEFNSINRTLLLKSRLKQTDKHKGYDISAINGKEFIAENVEQIVGLNTDQIHYIKRNVKVASSNNIPYYNSDDIDINDFIEHIVKGFRIMYNLILSLKDVSEFLMHIYMLRNTVVRTLVRNTEQYDSIIRHSWHPSHMKDMLEREKILENMWSNELFDDFIVSSEM